jgi:TetR/AcrR family transcriptional repressor of nem operon
VPRPRSRSREEVVAAAKTTFWELGYVGTSLSDLERQTGVNRSSLYAEFGSKQHLFSEVLDLYHDEVVEPLIGGMEADPSAAAIAEFFWGVKRIIVEGQAGDHRGCLLVNTIAELSPRDETAAQRGVEFRDRLLAAFRGALEHEASSGRNGDGFVDRRASMLLASTLGIWVCARMDPGDAADRCDELIAEVLRWTSTSVPR